MTLRYRYFDVDASGRVVSSRNVPIGASVDAEGMTVPEMPKDAVYALYYHAEQGFHWVKVGDLAVAEPAPDPADQLRADMDYLKMMEGA